jgi:hypothetical protein
MVGVVLTTLPRTVVELRNGPNPRYQPSVISDAFTARVIGSVVVLFVLIIDVSMSMFSRPAGSPLFPFALYASLPSLPFIIGGAVLVARAKRFDKK